MTNIVLRLLGGRNNLFPIDDLDPVAAPPATDQTATSRGAALTYPQSRPAPFTATMLFAGLAPDPEPIQVQLRLDWFTSNPQRVAELKYDSAQGALARAQQVLTIARMERWNAFEWWQGERCAEAEAAYVRGLQGELDAEEAVRRAEVKLRATMLAWLEATGR